MSQVGNAHFECVIKMSNIRGNVCSAQNVVSLGYITITPIYGPQQLSDTYSSTIKPSIGTTYVEPIGRKELATTWWKNCPNQCMAHLPSNKPCTQYCKSLRKNVSILSKKMISTKRVKMNEAMKWDNSDDVHIRNDKVVNNYENQILMTHTDAAQKRQANLIHIVPMPQSNTSHIASLDTLCYNLRVGNAWHQPWMQFYVSIVQPRPTIIPVLSRTKTTSTKSTTPAKRKLEFHSDNYPLDDKYSTPEAEMELFVDKYYSLADDRSILQHQDGKCINIAKPTEPERCRFTTDATNPTYEQYVNQEPQDILLYHSEESETTIATDDKPFIITTQQLIGENTTKSTPKDTSKRVPEVTPGTALYRDSSGKEVVDESFTEQNPSQRRLFPVDHDQSSDTFRINKHCERIFQDGIIEKNEGRNSLRPSVAIEHCLDRKSNDECTNDEQTLSSQQENQVGDSDEEPYGTYLSLPIPESYVPTTLHNNAKLSLDQPIYNAMKEDTRYSLGSLEDCPQRTKVVDLTYHDWKNMNTGQQPTEFRMKSTSRFRRTMLELILLNNKEMESDTTNGRKLWLPSLFNNDTILSQSWKFGKFT